MTQDLPPLILRELTPKRTYNDIAVPDFYRGNRTSGYLEEKSRAIKYLGQFRHMKAKADEDDYRETIKDRVSFDPSLNPILATEVPVAPHLVEALFLLGLISGCAVVWERNSTVAIIIGVETSGKELFRVWNTMQNTPPIYAGHIMDRMTHDAMKQQRRITVTTATLSFRIFDPMVLKTGGSFT